MSFLQVLDFGANLTTVQQSNMRTLVKQTTVVVFSHDVPSSPKTNGADAPQGSGAHGLVHRHDGSRVRGREACGVS